MKLKDLKKLIREELGKLKEQGPRPLGPPQNAGRSNVSPVKVMGGKSMHSEFNKALFGNEGDGPSSIDVLDRLCQQITGNSSSTFYYESSGGEGDGYGYDAPFSASMGCR